MSRYPRRQPGYGGEQMDWQTTSQAAYRNPSHSRSTDGRKAAVRYQQSQLQAQRHRVLQASEQMLYDVYAHTMGMIEELEKHEEQGQLVEKSGLLRHILPNPKEETMPQQEVLAKIETELTCLDAQIKFCQMDPEKKKESISKMRRKTLKWCAAREEKGVPISPVDQYAKTVLMVLEGQPLALPVREKGPEVPLNERTVNEVLYQYGQARQQGDRQDKEFKDDPNKKAAVHKMRQGQHESDGEKRLQRLDLC